MAISLRFATSSFFGGGGSETELSGSGIAVAWVLL
jgi:hypothetical protein